MSERMTLSDEVMLLSSAMITVDWDRETDGLFGGILDLYSDRKFVCEGRSVRDDVRVSDGFFGGMMTM